MIPFSDKRFRENQNTFYGQELLPKMVLLRGNVEKYGTDKQTTDDNIIRPMHFVCVISKATDTHS
jgi:hypothetical protein